jgi:hypothetical protein
MCGSIQADGNFAILRTIPQKGSEFPRVYEVSESDVAECLRAFSLLPSPL